MADRMTPKVSICVPNLNTRPFLDERFRSIQAQTLQDWELLVYDSYSTDGAWEYIQDLAGREPRMRAWQGPREGTPGSWNPCIREARGQYVYIATSDDTMAHDCLEQLAAALDAHPECDLAHCPLRAFDADGREITALSGWWARDSIFAAASGSLAHHRHVRQAPFDGLLHLLGGSVYISITQLLIRRSLFDRVGLFESTWGSVGDFDWCMRASLLGSTVHVPSTWGGWRVHQSQATATVAMGSAAHTEKIEGMIDHALEKCLPLLGRDLEEIVSRRLRQQSRNLREYLRQLQQRQGRGERLAFVARQLVVGSRPARDHVRLRIRGGSLFDWPRERLVRSGSPPPLVAVATGTADTSDGRKTDAGGPCAV